MGIENSDSLKSPPVGTSKIPDVLKPWSSYSPADYTMDQHHNASLIHNHDGPPTSKDQCKLPIKTPSGMVHPGGVMAAAASLGGVQASSDQKATAAKMLITHYKKMNTEPPPALKKLAHSIDVANFLEHYGTKGQKWGIRNARARITSGKKSVPQSEDSKTARKLQSRPPHSLSNEELKKLNERLNLEQNASRLNPSKISKGKKHAQTVLATVGVGVALLNTPPGKALINAGRKAVIMTTGRDLVK